MGGDGDGLFCNRYIARGMSSDRKLVIVDKWCWRSWCWPAYGNRLDIGQIHTSVTPSVTHIIWWSPLGFVYQGYAGSQLEHEKSPIIPLNLLVKHHLFWWWATEGGWVRAGANTVPSLEASMMLCLGHWTLVQPQGHSWRLYNMVHQLWVSLFCLGHQVHFLDHWWTHHCTFIRKRQAANVVEVTTLLSLFVLIVGC